MNFNNNESEIKPNENITEPVCEQESSPESEVQSQDSVTKENGASSFSQNKFRLLCIAGAVFGVIVAAIRSLIIFGEYDNKIALYPNGAMQTAFWISLAAFALILFVAAVLLGKGKEKYRPDFEPMPVLFSQSLCAFSFAALAFVIILTSKSTDKLYQVLDSLLIVLSLISAASFFMQAYAKKESLSADAQTFLKCFGPICTLFIAFYMYFDKSSVIHNTNKQIATVAFVFSLLFLLYSVKLYVSRVKLGIYAFWCSATVFVSVAYAVPNIVWFFMKRSPLLINVFFDILVISLGVYAACVLCSVKRADTPAKEKKEVECASSHTNCDAEPETCPDASSESDVIGEGVTNAETAPVSECEATSEDEE